MRGSNNTPPVLTDMQQRYEAETGSTMFSKPPENTGGRYGGGKDKKAFEEWSKTTAGMDAGKNKFNEMMANRSQNPVLSQTQAGMSGFDQFQAMQAGRNVPTLGQPSSATASGWNGVIQAAGDIMGAEQRNAAQDGKLNQAGYDKFQAMQAARDNTVYAANNPFKGLLGSMDVSSGPLQDKMQANAARQRSEQGAIFNAAMGANPLILQQLQMGQRQMGPQFNAFGFGAQPGLAAQGGQGGGMLANMSSQGMNQLAAGQQNNPTIFKAKS
tara:strand:- start:69 stop:878 length:810 start_codon:yes stop_codon:yes gene_type:complete